MNVTGLIDDGRGEQIHLFPLNIWSDCPILILAMHTDEEEKL